MPANKPVSETELRDFDNWKMHGEIYYCFKKMSRNRKSPEIQVPGVNRVGKNYFQSSAQNKNIKIKRLRTKKNENC